MKLHLRNGVYMIESTYEERHLPKAAGAWWHGGGCRMGCRACAAGLPLKVWWAPTPEVAAKLREYSTAEAAQALDGRAASVEASRAEEAPANVVIPVPEGRAYLPFQAAGIAYASARQSTLIADEMGLGKTIQALGVINLDASVRNVLVICPETVRRNWVREGERWLTRPFSFHIVGKAAIPADATFVVCGYTRARMAASRTALLARTWDVLVVDEAHRCKNQKALQTKAILGSKGEAGFAGKARRRLFLTGTPILNKPIDIWPIVQAAAPAEFPSFWAFAKRFCNAHQDARGYWDMDGASNLGELQAKLRASCMVRRLKADVLTELPAKRRQVIEIEQNGCAKLVANEAAAWASNEASVEAARVAVEIAKVGEDDEAYRLAVANLREAVGVAFTAIARVRHELALAKAPEVVAHVAGLLEEGTEKVVVMAHHKDVVAALEAGLAEYGVVALTGETPQEARQGIVDAFQAEGGPRVFVGSITAAGVGITLTAASTVIFGELDWVPANITQAEDRCHRIGQTGQVLIQHLVVDGSLDARMAKALVAKQEIAEKALDLGGAADEVILPEMEDAKARVERDLSRAEIAKLAPSMAPAKVAAIHQGIRIVAGVCDGAVAQDGVGFNGTWARAGAWLAGLPSLTQRQAVLGQRILGVHHRQVPAEIMEVVRG